MDAVTLTWPGGENRFALPIGGLRAVQTHCDAGPIEILRGLQIGSWKVDWPFVVIRHGLIGGGMGEAEARKLVDRMADTYPCGKFVSTAMIIMGAAVVGVEDDPVGEPQGVTTTPPENGSSATSTKTAPRAGTRRKKSTK